MTRRGARPARHPSTAEVPRQVAEGAIDEEPALPATTETHHATIATIAHNVAACAVVRQLGVVPAFCDEEVVDLIRGLRL